MSSLFCEKPYSENVNIFGFNESEFKCFSDGVGGVGVGGGIAGGFGNEVGKGFLSWLEDIGIGEEMGIVESDTTLYFEKMLGTSLLSWISVVFSYLCLLVDTYKFELLVAPYVIAMGYLFVSFLVMRIRYFSVSHFLLSLPFFGNKIKEKLKKTTFDLESSLKTNYAFCDAIPDKGKTEDEVVAIVNYMNTLSNENANGEGMGDDIGENQKISGVVYLGSEEHNKKCMKLFEMFALSNPLHPDLFPCVRNMEIDIVNMVGSMFGLAPEMAYGNVTYGGTESILLACLTYRDYFACGKRGSRRVTKPNIVVFDTVHPAFDKACHYFSIECRKVPSGMSGMSGMSGVSGMDGADDFAYESVKNLLKPYIDRNTICLVGSAPNYSYGLIDPIWGMGKVAQEYDIGFHVDACMGGFLIPFLTQYDWINFRVPGVTSISVDTHKYGYSFKGSSVLLFKDYCYKQYQHFIQKDWNGGIYATPTMMGSKSGGLIAATWGSLLYTGKNNYKKFAVTIQKNVRYIVNVFRTHQILKEHVKIIGNPQINIIAFTDMMGYGAGAESGNGNDGDVCGPVGIYNVLDYMKKRGWNLSVMQNPNAFHLCITNLHDRDVCQLFCETMVEAVEYCLQDTEKKLSGTLALYGSSTQIQNSLFLEDIIHNYIFLLSKNTILEKYF